MLGDLDSHDRSARSLCNASPAVVVAVDYRRTPEHRFPAALNGTYAALWWPAKTPRCWDGWR
ncbi:alpha/beta hydrolase fold domain-containing protein [Pseudarthrobacter naphthalenicus]|uniref:alpha/beta hydrolase fold domain-containing protein n=1 Tax=Pseudarthrobacter naphthalenicus TaxID=3031328 RepID=UPI003AF17065